MTQAEKDQLTIIYLNALIATNFLMTCMELMEGAPIYKHKLKMAAKRFVKELDSVTSKDLNEIFGIDDLTMYKIMEDQEELLKVIAVSRPESCTIILKMIEKFNQAPQAIVNWLGLENEVKINK